MNHSMIMETGAGSVALTAQQFGRDVLAGLSRPVKSLPCKYFYDERGAQLFEAICELEEYYPTRTEVGILRQCLQEVAALVGPRCSLLELGSGSGLKTRLLLDHLLEPARYIPVDVAREQLLEWTRQLAHAYPDLVVWPVCADYTRDLELLELPPDSQPMLLFFPGSTIGNLEPKEAVDFLRRLRTLCGPRAGFLLGVDLKKDLELLLPAYNDAQGITADFNLNLLVRANRELGTDFDLAQFRHQARYNQRAGRIEMHLVSRRPQRVTVGETSFFFAAGESIVTEYSYKYSVEEFRRLAARAGWQVSRCWTDEARWFSVQYLQPGPAKNKTAFQKI